MIGEAVNNNKFRNQGETLPSLRDLHLEPFNFSHTTYNNLPPIRTFPSVQQSHADQLPSLGSIFQGPTSRSAVSAFRSREHDATYRRRVSSATVTSRTLQQGSGTVFANHTECSSADRPSLQAQGWEADSPDTTLPSPSPPHRRLRRKSTRRSPHRRSPPVTEPISATISRYIEESNRNGTAKCRQGKAGCPNRQKSDNRTTVSLENGYLLTYCRDCKRVTTRKALTTRTDIKKFEHQLQEQERRGDQCTQFIKYQKDLKADGYVWPPSIKKLSTQNQTMGMEDERMEYEKIDTLKAFYENKKEKDTIIVKQQAIIDEQKRNIAQLKCLLEASGCGDVYYKMEARSACTTPYDFRHLTPASSPASPQPRPSS